MVMSVIKGAIDQNLDETDPVTGLMTFMPVACGPNCELKTIHFTGSVVIQL
jgi:hypothetical protein